MKLSILALASVLMTLVSASSSLESSELISKRASFPVPASKGKVTFKAPQVIAKGKTYDGGLKTYGRGVKCGGQSEVRVLDRVLPVLFKGPYSHLESRA
jgi:hypothetical protein